MLQFQQSFDSPSADLGVLATNLSRGIFDHRPVSNSEEETPDSAGAYESGGSTVHVNLELEDVVAHIKKGDHLTPNDALAAFNLGVAYKVLGRWAESAEAFTKALDFLAKLDDDEYHNRNLATTYYMRGYAYASLATRQEEEEARRNFERAERDYLEALELKKDYMLVYCYLGVLYGVQSRWDEAEKALKKAIRLKPRYAGAHHDLGVIYAQSGRPRLALKAFEKAVQYEPKNLLLLRHLAEAYYQAERWADARRILQRVLKLDPKDQEALLKLGGVYLHFGNFQKAEESLLKVLELDPEEVAAYSNLGIVYFKAGRLGDAAAALNRALELEHPDTEGLTNGLSAVQQSMLEVVADAYLGILSCGIELDMNSLVAQLLKVRETISGKKESHLKALDVYFTDHLMYSLASIAEQIGSALRFRLAAKLFEQGMLSSEMAAPLARIDHTEFLLGLKRAGIMATGDYEQRTEGEDAYLLTALEAERVANRLLRDNLPDRFMATDPKLDTALHVWHIPVVLSYPVIGAIGEVGEILIRRVDGEVISHTPFNEMRSQANRLYAQHHDAIEAPVL